ncbi:MAG: hypothetical protein ACI92G_002903 [Candidatus Pelagisphaera sp.]|jgi:hypothetical protein
MAGKKPKITSWRAFVDGKQIGSGYESKSQALEVAQDYIEYLGDENAYLTIEAKPSFIPIRKLV